jgi:CRP/FNR family nitrogen fixation transcriptional regulator
MQATLARGTEGLAVPRSMVAHPPGPDPLNLLEQFGTTISVSRNHQIQAQGDPSVYIWRVLAGCVRTVKLLEDGRRHVGEFLFPGGLLALEAAGVCDFAAEAVTDVELRRYKRRMVESLAESHAGLTGRLREISFGKLRAAQARLVLLGRKTATERVASFLIELDAGAAACGRADLALPMCRTDIADHLGLTVETVCRVLAQLKREGVLAISRSGVEIRQHRTLHLLASEVRN